MNAYEQLTLRNGGYVPTALQERIRATRVLVAGCGVGSTIAEAAVRVGFDKLVLVDGDVVEPHNLNRQAFTAADVGRPKVSGLASRLRAIYPGTEVDVFDGWLGPDNAAELVSRCDLVFDTIDFLSLEAITALHDEAQRQGKPVLSAFSAGWGAGAMYFPPDGCTFRQVFGLPEQGSVAGASYAEHFAVLVQRLAGTLDQDIVQALGKALTLMEDGRPCPAPHVSAGSASVAGLAVTAAVRLLADKPVTPAPRMLLVDLSSLCAGEGIDLAEGA